MQAEILYLGKDAFYWAVAACLLTLSILILLVLKRRMLECLLEPHLFIQDQELAEASARLGDFLLAVRLPLANKSRKVAAQEVEVFLEGIQAEHTNYPFKQPSSLPIRLKWKDTHESICHQIEKGQSRLLELGLVTFGTIPEIIQGGRPPTEFQFLLDDQTQERWLLPVGTFKLRLLINSAGGHPIRETFTLTIRAAENSPEKPVSDYIQLIKD